MADACATTIPIQQGLVLFEFSIMVRFTYVLIEVALITERIGSPSLMASERRLI